MSLERMDSQSGLSLVETDPTRVAGALRQAAREEARLAQEAREVQREAQEVRHDRLTEAESRWDDTPVFAGSIAVGSPQFLN